MSDEFNMFGNIDSFIEKSFDDGITNDATTPLCSDSSLNISDLGDVKQPNRKRKTKEELENERAEAEIKKLVDIEAMPKPNLTPGKGQITAMKKFQRLKKELELKKMGISSEDDDSPISSPMRPEMFGQSTPVAASSKHRVGVNLRKRRTKYNTRTTDVFSPKTSSTNNADDCITLDSDSEFEKSYNDTSLDTFEAENYLMSIKVNWNGTIQKFPHRKHQKFEDLMNTLAQRENTSPQQILLILNDKIIVNTDTPDSIGLTIGKFISGRVIAQESGLMLPAKNTTKSKNTIDLKIQSAIWKKPLVISIEKTDKLKILVIKCAEELKCAPQTLNLRFDGEALDINATADELDLEGGEMLDLRITE